MDYAVLFINIDSKSGLLVQKIGLFSDEFLNIDKFCPNYKYFFYELAKEIESRGHNIYFAIDSHRSKYLEPLPELDNNQNSFFLIAI